jgi:PII-like signaling protein
MTEPGMLSEQGHLLRIFIGESDRYEGMPLYEWLIRKAKETGLAGGTVMRGIEGFGARSRIRSARPLDLSTDLPIVVEIVDTLEKIDRFMPVVDEAVKEGLATIEKATVHFYRINKNK